MYTHRNRKPRTMNSPEFQNLIQQESQKAMIHQAVAKVTKECWEKCITGAPGSKFSSGESSCLSNCAQRYMDFNRTIMQRFQSMQR